MTVSARGLVGLALDWLLPPRCALCARDGSALCEGCIAGLPAAGGERCERCWRPMSEPYCVSCAEWQPACASVRAPYRMTGTARRLVHELKYEGLSSLGEPMSRLMAPLAPSQCDVVVPVPLAGSRRRARGYNQAEEMARGIARSLGRPLDAAMLRRTRATDALADSHSAAERRRIVTGAFAADEARARGRAVLLIDDVVTTGATVDACARALLGAGASLVHALAFARED